MISFGFTPEQDLFLRETLTHHLGASIRCLVWIFGSRARGTQRPYSDVDLLIESTPTLSLSSVDRLSDALEDSDFPYKVDLVRIEDLVPAYRNQILSERQLFWEK